MPQRKKAELPTPVHLIDTNVLVRFIIGDDPQKAARAAALMERVERGEANIELTEAVLTETAWVLQRFYEVPRPEIAKHLGTILSFNGVRVISHAVFSLALELFAGSNPSIVDCLLAARSRLREVPIYTYDETDFKKLNCKWEKP